jgi:uncharacterized DUF497 family protein
MEVVKGNRKAIVVCALRGEAIRVISARFLPQERPGLLWIFLDQPL